MPRLLSQTRSYPAFIFRVMLEMGDNSFGLSEVMDLQAERFISELLLFFSKTLLGGSCYC
jgi:hypothetical protein